MARRLIAQGAAQQSVMEFVEPVRRRKSKGGRRMSGVPKAKVAKAKVELEALMTARDWSEFKPLHLVLLWAKCHEKVYGVAPDVEMTGAKWKLAAVHAEKLVEHEFGGDVQEAIEFVRWSWLRERHREAMAKRNGQARVSRIGWRLQFAQRYLVTDYRIDKARNG